jgi:hypothetical protein
MRLGLEKLHFMVLLVILLLPIWVFPYFPTQDGPAHVDNAAVFHYLYYGRGSESLLHDYYHLNLRLAPNWFTDMIMAGLIGFVSPPVVEKILLSSYVILLPVSIRYALSAVNQASTFLAILAFPLVYNSIMHRGFYNFLFSIPVFFFVIGYWLRHHSRWKPRDILCFASLVLLLYFCHVVALVTLGVTLCLLALTLSVASAGLNYSTLSSMLRGSWRLFYNRSWLFLFLGLTPACFLAARFIFQQGSPPSWRDAEYSWKFFAWPLYGVVAITNHPAHLLVSTSVSLVFAGLLFYSIRHKAAHPNLPLWHGLLLSVCGICVLYVVAPSDMSGGNMINQRFILFTLLLAILLFAIQQFSERAKFMVSMGGTGLVMLQLALNIPVYAKVNAEAAEYFSGHTVLQTNATLIALCFAIEGCGYGKRPGYLRIAPFTHFSGYLSAQQHLVNLYIHGPQTNYFPIQYRAGLAARPYLLPSLSEGKRIFGEKIAEYTEQTPGRIDYVLLWQLPDAWSVGDDPTPLLRWLSANYELIFTSTARRLQVYRRKGLSSW